MKYNNKITRYGNQTYHSKLEADYAAQLDFMVKAGEIQDWSSQFKLRLHKDKVFLGNIIPDFWVKGKHGQEEIHECKSPISKTTIWRWKWKHCKVEYPEYKYVVIMRKDISVI